MGALATSSETLGRFEYERDGSGGITVTGSQLAAVSAGPRFSNCSAKPHEYARKNKPVLVVIDQIAGAIGCPARSTTGGCKLDPIKGGRGLTIGYEPCRKDEEREMGILDDSAFEVALSSLEHTIRGAVQSVAGGGDMDWNVGLATKSLQNVEMPTSVVLTREDGGRKLQSNQKTALNEAMAPFGMQIGETGRKRLTLVPKGSTEDESSGQGRRGRKKGKKKK